jgi:hypothetical protein
LALKSPNKIVIMVFREFIEYSFQFLIEAVFHILSLSSVGA